MAKKDPPPEDDLMSQVADLLALIEANKKKFTKGKPLPKGLGEVVEDLETQMELFRALSDAVVESTPISSEKPKKDSHFEKRVERLRRKTESLKGEVQKKLGAVKKTEERKGSDEKSVPPKKRRKKFRRLGEKKGWKPL